MSSLKTLAAALSLAAVAVVSGCATPSDMEKVRTSLLEEMARNSKAQQDQIAILQGQIAKLEANQQLHAERTKNLEQRLETVAKIPRELEAAVAAVMNYVREVEKNIHSLRDLTARELDRQNAHIQRVKTAYGAVLQQEIQNAGAVKKTLDATMTDLMTTLENSLKTLKEALPGTDETLPQPPQFPQPTEGAAPAPQSPKPQ